MLMEKTYAPSLLIRPQYSHHERPDEKEAVEVGTLSVVE